MWRRAAVGLGVVAVSAIVLSACGQSALALARQACGEVHSSIMSYEAGIHAKTRSTMIRDLRRANDDLQAAEPIAAAATSADGQWNALMTTLNEIGQVDEGHLISALQAQCAVANGDQQDFPGSPTKLPPVPDSAPAGAGSTTTAPVTQKATTTIG